MTFTYKSSDKATRACLRVLVGWLCLALGGDLLPGIDAQLTTPRQTEFQLEQIGKDRLPESLGLNPWRTLQDNDGFMWFATSHILQRWSGEGINPKKIPIPVISGSPLERLRIFRYDPHAHQLWLADKKQLVRFDIETEEFDLIPLSFESWSNPWIRDVLVGREDDLWIATNKGLLHWSLKTDEGRPLSPSTLFACEELAFDKAKPGNLLVQSQGELLSLSIEDPTDRQVLLQRPPQFRFLQSDNGEIWILESSSLSQLDYSSGATQLIADGLVEADALAQDPVTGGLWVSGDNRLPHYIRTDLGLHLMQQETVKGKAISPANTFVDRSGKVWLSCLRGGEIWMIDPYDQPFVVTELSHRPTLAVAPADPNSAKWLWCSGPDNFRLIDVEANQEPPISVELDEYQGSARNLVVLDDYVVTWKQDELSIYSKDECKFEAPWIDDRLTKISSLLSLGGNTLLVGTRDGLLTVDVKRRQAVSFYQVLNFAESSSRILLYETQDAGNWSGTWAATSLGVTFFGRDLNSHQTLNLKLQRQLPRNITDIKMVGGNELWLACEQGLASFSLPSREEASADTPGVLHIATPSAERRLPATNTGGQSLDVCLSPIQCFSVVEDRVWFTAPGYLAAFHLRKGKLELYDSLGWSDNSQFNFSPLTELPDGRIAVSHDEGLFLFDPRHTRINRVPPKMAITAVEADGKRAKFSAPGRKLPFHAPPANPAPMSDLRVGSRIAVYFAALDFSDHNEGHRPLFEYQFRLAGSPEVEWEEIDSNVVSLPPLPEGDFHFEVRGANSDGVWAEQSASLLLSVPKPFYRTGLFRFLVSAAVLSLFYMGFRFRTRVIREANLQLQDSNASLEVSNRKLRDEVEERIRAESALGESESRYRKIFEESTDAMFAADLTGRISEINPAGVALFGFKSRADLLKDDFNLSSVISKDDWVAFHSGLKHHGEVQANRMSMHFQNGRRIDVELSGKTIDLDVGPGNSIASRDASIRFSGILKDITDKLVLDEHTMRSQKLEAIGTMAGGISHDFNNILMVVMGSCELAEMSSDDEDLEGTRKHIDSIMAAAQRARALVTQILDFSRKSKTVLEEVEVNEIVSEAVHFLRQTIPPTIQLSAELVKTKRKVMADPAKLHQVALNLGTNAFHAVREQGGNITITTEEFDLEGGASSPAENLVPGPYLKVTITDDGPGIDSSTLKRIFEPFFTTKDVGVGTGMGLSVVHGIVSDLDGAVIVKTQPGHGASFEVFLPAVQDPGVKAKLKPRPKIMRGDETILLVDDEPAILDVVTNNLKALGYQVLSAGDPNSALALLDAHGKEIALVITDHAMPIMTGVELSREIQSRHPKLPIIMMTGYGDAVFDETPPSDLLHLVLSKPTPTAVLSQSIRQAIEAGPGQSESTEVNGEPKGWPSH